MEGLIGQISISCEDETVEYAQFDNVRFIFKGGDYVGWYAC